MFPASFQKSAKLLIAVALSAGLFVAPTIAASNAKAAAITVASHPLRGMPTVDIMINNKGPYRFGIDTGAPGPLRIDSALAAELGLKKVREMRDGDGSGVNDFTAPVYRVDRVSMGSAKLGAQEAEALDFGRWGGEIKGMFGMDALAGTLLVLDYGSDTVSLEPGVLPRPDNRRIFGYTVTRDGLISLTLEIGGKPVPVILDTGQTASALMLPEAIARQTTAGEPQQSGAIHTASNSIPIFSAPPAGKVMLGKLELPVGKLTYPASSGAQLAPTSVVPTLGSKALQGARIRLDQKNHRIEIRWPHSEQAH